MRITREVILEARKKLLLTRDDFECALDESYSKYLDCVSEDCTELLCRASACETFEQAIGSMKRGKTIQELVQEQLEMEQKE